MAGRFSEAASTPYGYFALASNHRARCDFCGRDMQYWISVTGDYRRPNAAEETFHLYWCRQDKFGKIYPRPTADDVPKFYSLDSYYTHQSPQEKNGRHDKSGFFQRLRHHLAWRFDFGNELGTNDLSELARRGARSILDVGCGNGTRLQEAAAAGFETVAGIEPDPISREIAVSRGFNVYSGTAENPPAELSDRKFDVIVLMHVLEHTLDPQEAINSLRRMLNPSGCLIVETPNNLAAGCRLAGKCWAWLDVPRHLNFFCSKSLQRLLENAGLNITQTDFCGYSRQFSQEWLEKEVTISQFLARNEASPSRLEMFRRGLRAWTLLCLTMISTSNIKYDSVRVMARNRVGS